jgi:cyclomaltodextrinase / maltogenic alpha-amylase / neopullulanase
MRLLNFPLCIVIAFAMTAQSAEVRLLHKDAVVWSQTQVVRGKVGPAISGQGTLFLNSTAHPITVTSPGDSFSVVVRLPEGTSTLVALFDSAGIPVHSDTLRWTLGFNIRPEVYCYATVAGANVVLHAAVLENPDSSLLSFHWSPRASNPSPVSLQLIGDSAASFGVDAAMGHGEYYFDLTACSSRGDTVRPATLVTVDSTGAHAFDIARDHAGWVDSAVLYSIAPHLFMSDGKLSDIRAALPELAELGINTVWILPIFPTPELNLGYHVLDYFRVRSDIGTEQDLRDLVTDAHARGMKVILDLVPNHTTIYHPYAQDAIEYGELSHYYDFYDHTGAMTQTLGLMQFGGYFYPELVNLNFGNPEVCRMMTEAGRYWIEKFNVDGYRLDMVWAVDQRFPDYMRTWSLAMKRWKPDILLLGETFATPSSDPSSGLADERYDAAYDWKALGHGSWEGLFGDRTDSPASQLRDRIAHAAVPGGKVLRFLENNDAARFLSMYTMSKLRMAATLMFTIHGLPMLYMGQEIGCTVHPWDGVPVFTREASIRSQDHLGLFPYYQSLAQLRRQFPLFTSDFAEAPWISPSRNVYAYHRWNATQHAFCVLNMVSTPILARMIFPVGALKLDTTRTYYLTDVISGEVFPVRVADLSLYDISLPPYAARVFILGAEPLVVGVKQEEMAAEIPKVIALEQNYPNPFNPETVIEYALPATARISLKVVDVLGRTVALLIDGECIPGRHQVAFDGRSLASGPYFYVLRAGQTTKIGKMLLVR